MISEKALLFFMLIWVLMRYSVMAQVLLEYLIKIKCSFNKDFTPLCGEVRSAAQYLEGRVKKASEKLEIYRTLPRVNISDT
jgi:hypothetical protein